MNDGYWGYHQILDISGCDNTAIQDKTVIYRWVKDLVKRIDMVAYGEPVIEHFATHDPAKAGISCVQLIETSNICVHFVPQDNTAYVDVFSCKTFDTEEVKRCFSEYFGGTRMRMTFLHRQA